MKDTVMDKRTARIRAINESLVNSAAPIMARIRHVADAISIIPKLEQHIPPMPNPTPVLPLPSQGIDITVPGCGHRITLGAPMRPGFDRMLGCNYCEVNTLTRWICRT